MESKSFKLYLNSFNMMRYGETTTDCLKICKSMIEHDLSEKLQTDVKINYIENDALRTEIFSEFRDIMSLVDENTIEVKSYKEAPEVLKVKPIGKVETHYLKFDSLRSNCRVTHQPDFGDLFVYYKSEKRILEDSLVKYLCSFRSEFHFHEECCEMIFKRLRDLLGVNDELFVCALYTRRGGIDICPVRFSKNCDFRGFESLIDLTKFARCGVKQ